jgi:hypothetical protein
MRLDGGFGFWVSFLCLECVFLFRLRPLKEERIGGPLPPLPLYPLLELRAREGSWLGCWDQPAGRT